MMNIPVIDLFAGPGGLGEGFSVLQDEYCNSVFDVVLSIEKENYAWQTLLLRSFYRQFPTKDVPEVFYKFARSGRTDITYLEELLKEEEEEIYRKYLNARDTAWKAALGNISEEELDERIKSKLNGKRNWVLIGGPPCQAYSLIGRSRNKGIDPDDPKVYLYREYYRILAVHSPPLFVMENVKGLLSAKVRESPIFDQILNDIKDPVRAYSALNGKDNKISDCPGYHIYSFVRQPRLNTNKILSEDDKSFFEHGDFIIRSEEYGIPQARHRVILLGVRKDLVNDLNPPLLDGDKPKVSAGEVLRGLPDIRSGLSKSKDSHENWVNNISNFNISQLRDKFDGALYGKIKETVNFIKTRDLKLDRGGEFLGRKTNVEYKPDWFLDNRMGGVCNHSARGHIPEDLHRYLFVSAFGKVYGRSPKLNDFPTFLLPNHKNASKKRKNYKFADRFRVQLEHEPAKTVTSHISKDGHYYIHFDSNQCRSMTVREAARLQTFPDNYLFCGSRTSQYVQVGNAVPPLLAIEISKIVYEVLKKIGLISYDCHLEK